MSNHNTGLIGNGLLILLMLPTIIFSVSYSSTIAADPTYDAGTRAFMEMLPLILTVVEVALGLLLLYQVAVRGRG